MPAGFRRARLDPRPRGALRRAPSAPARGRTGQSRAGLHADGRPVPLSYRIFTVPQANELIPVLERAFRRIEDARERARDRHEKLQVLDALWGDEVQQPENPDHDEWRRHRRKLGEAVGTLESTVKTEILDRGLRFPAGGLENGLVDFPSSHEGRWVYLCWERGEPELRYWHEVDGGYAGRRPITDALAESMGRDDPGDLDDSRLDF